MNCPSTEKQQNEASRITLWVNFINREQYTHLAEVGVWKGEFAKALLQQCPTICNYLMIDSWRNLEGWNKPFNVSNEDFFSIYQQALSNTSFAGNKVRILRGTTLEVRHSIDDTSLDFVYIDGDHSLRGIVIDAISMWPKVRAGGVLAGDDFTETVWQHPRDFEPSLVNPFMRYFADAVGEELHVLSCGQYFIRKTSSHGLGESAPKSMKVALLPLLEMRKTHMDQKAGLKDEVRNLTTRASKALLRRCSSRYREREALARHRIPFPDCYKKSGVVFIHVPKAAGTSVSAALYGRNLGHWSLSTLWDMYPHSMRACRTCAIVREPVSRFVSAFNYLKKGGMNSYDKAFSEKYLAQFNTAEECALHLINGASKKTILEFEHFRTQVSWMFDAKLGKTADCVVAITQLDILRKWLMHLTGEEYAFGKLNALTKGANDKETLSPHVRSGIESIYASDVVLYNALVEKPGCMISAAKVKAGYNPALRKILVDKTRLS